MLAATALGLAAGGIAAVAGAGTARDAMWLGSAAAGLGYALWVTVGSVRRAGSGLMSSRCWRWRVRWLSAKCWLLR